MGSFDVLLDDERAQLGAFLMLLRHKEESAEELNRTDDPLDLSPFEGEAFFTSAISA